VELLALFTSYTVAASGGASFVQVLTALGALSGVAAFIGVFVQLWTNSRKAKVDTKTVAITELEKAVPGMGTIIEQWQRIVDRLQSENNDLRKRVAELEAERDERV
jgi:hypothetical protein